MVAFAKKITILKIRITLSAPKSESLKVDLKNLALVVRELISPIANPRFYHPHTKIKLMDFFIIETSHTTGH